jgi:hypothetical protein
VYTKDISLFVGRFQAASSLNVFTDRDWANTWFSFPLFVSRNMNFIFLFFRCNVLPRKGQYSATNE